MDPLIDPYTVLLDFELGTLTPATAAIESRCGRDMEGYFLVSPPTPDQLIYTVTPMPPPRRHHAEIACSTTVIQPGAVEGEFHMTKGHFHEVRDRSEIYIGLAGDGLLLQATSDGRHHVAPIHRGTVNYVPGGWAHRSVNTGTEPLVFFAAYIGDAGQDYGTILEYGFPVVICQGPEGFEIRVNPRYSPVVTESS